MRCGWPDTRVLIPALLVNDSGLLQALDTGHRSFASKRFITEAGNDALAAALLRS